MAAAGRHHDPQGGPPPPRRRPPEARGAAAAAGDGDDVDLDQILSREPSPDFAAQVAEEWRRLLGLLGDAELETVALRRIEGYTVEEIAAQVGYAPALH